MFGKEEREDNLSEAEQKSHVGVNALLLEDFTGSDAFPCRGDLQSASS